MIYDKKHGKVFYGYFVKHEYELTKNERKILNLLMDHNVYTADEIATKCDILSPGAVITQISKLRNKGIEIYSLYGRGYRLKTNIVEG